MSLVVLVFAFYELSGGKDFVPRSETRRLAAEASTDPAPISTPLTSSASVIAASVPSKTIARFPASSAGVDAAPGVDKTPSASAQPVRTASAGAVYPLPEGEDGVRSAGVTLVSLEENPALFARPLTDDRASGDAETMTVRATQAAALSSPVSGAADPARVKRADFFPSQRDIRAVDGDRVNMRNGPGTSFSVLASLPRDTRVEVLTDPGDGWVRLRPINGGPVGWIASYLLTNVN